MTNSDFQELAPSLPSAPGIYKFVDIAGVILYVGKAKSLKNRLSSYFGDRKDRHPKTAALVRNADHIEFTLVETEQDALLLECTLIKKHQPRYNVMLKDAKSYPYICIKKEPFPRVFITRKVVRDGSTYFGPYASVQRVAVVMDIIKQLFPLRTCALHLDPALIRKGKFKVCLEYHIKNCAGPCAGHESRESYDEKIAGIKNLLKGNFGAVKTLLRNEMQDHAENLAFEKAQHIKDRLRILEDYQGKSTVVSTNISDVDVFSIATDDKMAYVNYLKVVNGAIIHTYTQEMTKNLNEDEKELLAYTILSLQEKFHSFTEEIIVPFPIPLPDDKIAITIPKIGDKKKLLDLSEKNVKYFLLQKQRDEANRTKKQTPAERILRTLQKDLHMEALPLHIECFDNSNLQGTHPVSSCVVFRNAKPSKRDYRHFNVKTVEGPDDFATMEEVVYRRYKRLLAEKKPLPQLVIIDGGKGQLSSAINSLQRLGIEGQMTVIGIAKRLEEIYFPGDSVPVYIDKKSESLKLIQQARNEAHRFGITFHRDQRSRKFLRNELLDIPGIGETTAEKLLKHFGSVKKVKATTPEALAGIVGKRVAANILAFWATDTTPAPPGAEVGN